MTVPNLTGLVVLLDGNDVTILNYEEDGDLYLVADERTPEGWLVPGADFDGAPADQSFTEDEADRELADLAASEAAEDDEALRQVADDIDVLSDAATRPAPPFRVGRPMSAHGDFLRRWHGGQTGWPR
jgi:hypothetical protein